jgi:phosphoribosylformylglycinamidine (FGAM) synthase-like amidotransferase family enzyme
MPNALVIRTAGTNCDGEMVRAFTLAGAKASLVHLDRLVAEPERLDGFDLIGFPGGFSYGDDIASGRIFAMRVRERLYPALRRAVGRGVAMIGACNGFQVMVQVGLLPGPSAHPGLSAGMGLETVRRGDGETVRDAGGWPEGGAPGQTLSLAQNVAARFVDRWVPVEFDAASPCVWTRGLAEAGFSAEELCLPVAHGEGRLVGATPGMVPALVAAGQVPVRYLDNYNGSECAAAGVCDVSGLIFGLMPHPERYLEWNRHPFWTRLGERKRETPGMMMFRNAVEAVGKGRQTAYGKRQTGEEGGGRVAVGARQAADGMPRSGVRM